MSWAIIKAIITYAFPSMRKSNCLLWKRPIKVEHSFLLTLILDVIFKSLFRLERRKRNDVHMQTCQSNPEDEEACFALRVNCVALCLKTLAIWTRFNFHLSFAQQRKAIFNYFYSPIFIFSLFKCRPLSQKQARRKKTHF